MREVPERGRRSARRGHRAPEGCVRGGDTKSVRPAGRHLRVPGIDGPDLLPVAIQLQLPYPESGHGRERQGRTRLEVDLLGLRTTGGARCASTLTSFSAASCSTSCPAASRGSAPTGSSPTATATRGSPAAARPSELRQATLPPRSSRPGRPSSSPASPAPTPPAAHGAAQAASSSWPRSPPPAGDPHRRGGPRERLVREPARPETGALCSLPKSSRLSTDP